MKRSVLILLALSMSVSRLSAVTNYWDGSFNAYWHNANNWSLGHIPLASEDVVISATGYYPVKIDYYDEVCNNLTINAGATLIFQNGWDLDVGGNATVYGTLNMTGAGMLDVAGDMSWETGSSGAMSSSNVIMLDGNWEFKSGANVHLDYGQVIFSGSSVSYIRSKDHDCYLHMVGVSKTGGAAVSVSNLSTDTLKIKSTLTVNAGACFQSAGAVTTEIAGQVSNSGHIQLDNGTLRFNGTTQAFSMNTGDYFNNLTIAPTGAVTLNTNTVVNKNLLIERGTLNSNNLNLNVGGNWTNSVGASGFTEGTGKVVFDGGNYPQYVSDETFNTLEINKTAGGALRFNGTTVSCASYNWTAGALDVLPGGHFTANDLADNGIYGDIYLNNGGQIDLYNYGGTVNLLGNLYIYGGTMNVWSDEVWAYWPGAGNASVTMSGGIIDYKNATGIQVQTNSFVFTENITGGVIRTSGFFRADNANFTPAGGIVELYGSSNPIISNMNGGNFYTLKINKTAGGSPATAATNLDINGELVIQSGTLQVSSFDLDIAGETHIYGNLGMNNASGSIVAHGDIYWESGSTASITSTPTIDAYQNWYFQNGAEAFLTGVTVNFKGSTISYFRIFDDDSYLFSAVIQKTGGSYMAMSATSTQSLRFFGMITVSAGSEFRNNCSDTAVKIYVRSHFLNNGTCNLGFGAVVLNGSAQNINFNSPGYFHDLTLSSAGSVTLYSNIEIKGNFRRESGNLDANGFNISIGGDWRNVSVSGTFNPGSGRVIFNGGDYIQYCYNETFGILELNKYEYAYLWIEATTVSCSQYDWNSGALIVHSTGHFTAYDLYDNGITGEITVYSGAQVDLYNPGGTLNLMGNLYIYGGTMNIWGNNAWAYLPGAGNAFLAIGSEGVLDYKNVTGVKIQTNAYTFTENFNSGTLRTSGSFIADNSNFTPTGGTVELYGPSDATVSMVNGSNIDNLAINKSGTDLPLASTVTAASDLNITNLLEISAGTFQVAQHEVNVGSWTFISGTLGMNNASGILNVDGNIVWQNGSSAAITANATINAHGSWEFLSGAEVFLTNGTVNFKGSGNAVLLSNDDNSYFHTVNIQKTSGSYLALDAASTQSLRINGTFTVAAGAEFRDNCSDTVVMIILKSNFTNQGTFNLTQGKVKADGTVCIIEFINPGYFHDLEISTTSYTQLYSDIEVKGDLTIASGVLNSYGYFISIGGNWNDLIYPIGFIPSMGRVIFNGGNYHQYCSSENFEIIEVDKPSGGSLRVENDTVHCNHFDWTAGGVEAMAGGRFCADNTINPGIFGKFTANTGGRIDLANWDGTVDFSGDLILHGGVITIHGNGYESCHIPGSANSSITMNSGTLDFKLCGVYIAEVAGHTFTSNITGGTIKCSAHFWASHPAFNPSGGTVEMYGTGTVGIVATNSAKIYDLNINKDTTDFTSNNTVYAGGDITIDHNLTITRGHFQPNIATVDVQGTTEISGMLRFSQSGGKLNAYGNIYWRSGSAGSMINNTTLSVYKDWYFDDGAEVFLANGNVKFKGPLNSRIISNDDNSYLPNINIMKDSGHYTALENTSTKPLRVSGDFTVSAGSTLSNSCTDTAVKIYIKGNFLNQGTFNMYRGTVLLTGNTQQIDFDSPGFFFNLVIHPSISVTLLSDLEIYKDIILESGSLICGNHNIAIRGDWTDHAGTNGFQEGTGTVTFTGYIGTIFTDETFYRLVIDKMYESDWLLVDSNRTITVMDDINVIRGRLRLMSNCELDARKDINIDVEGTVNAAGDSTRYKLKGNVNCLSPQNYSDEGFAPGFSSTVILDGSADQVIHCSYGSVYYGSLNIDKPSGTFSTNAESLIYHDLNLIRGDWLPDIGGLYISLYGDLNISAGGRWLDSLSSFNFMGEGLTVNISGEAVFGIAVVHMNNNSDRVTLNSSLKTASGKNVNVFRGTLDLNGNSLLCGGNVDVYWYGSLLMPAASRIQPGPMKEVRVQGDGEIIMMGNPGNPAVISPASGYFDFIIENDGKISAAYAEIEKLSANGLVINELAIIDTANSFDHCTFTGGQAGGNLLTIQNSQDLTIDGAVFPANTWGGLNNISKTTDAGHITMNAYSGAFAGLSHESDPFNRVDWTTDLAATANALPPSLCAGSSTQLNALATGGLGPYIYHWAYDPGLNLPYIQNPIATPAATTTYTVTITDCYGNTATDDITVTVNPAPSAEAGPDMLINEGESATLNGSASGGNPPYTYEWSPATGLDDPLAQNPVANPSSTTTYTVTVTDANGCTATDAAVVTVIPAGGLEVHGMASYDNVFHTALKNIDIQLLQDYIPVATATTNAAGAFIFTGVNPGSYSLYAINTKPWGGGNATDALLIMRHFVNLAPLTGLRLAAADLDASGYVNTVDALNVMRRFVGMISNFPAGDWLMEEPVFEVMAAGVTQNIKGLCYGDVDGSYTPAAKSQLRLERDGDIAWMPGSMLELPVRVAPGTVAGAVSLVIEFPEGLLEITGVESAAPFDNLVWSAKHGELRIAAYSLNPTGTEQDGYLLRLKVKIHDPENLTAVNAGLALGTASEIADGDGNPINLLIGIPRIAVQPEPQGIILCSNHPNPFTLSTTITYFLPEAGKVSLTVCDAEGGMVASPVKGEQQGPGRHEVILDGSRLLPGVYFCIISVQSLSGTYTGTKKMLVEK